MKPVSNKIEFVRGDTYFISRYLEDKDGNVLIIDPETDEMIFTMKKDVESAEIIKKTLADIQVFSDGKYMITIEPEDTQELDFGKYGYDIEVTIGVEEETPLRRTVESGIIRLLKDDYSKHTSGGGQNG